MPANGRTDLRSVSVSHTGGEDEGFSFFFYGKRMSPDRIFFFDAQSSANGSEGATDNIPIPPRGEGTLIININSMPADNEKWSLYEV